MSCSNFHSKLNELRHDKKYCDVSVRVQEKSFPCHRVVLASASEYFEAMFGGCFKEKNDQEIFLQDIEAEIFQDIIRSVYTGKECNITPSNVHNLIHSALFLRIRSIEKGCAEFILKNLSSICDHIDIFRLVRAINITALTDALSEYIVQNFKSFYADERFMGMSFDDLKFILDKWLHNKLPFKHENLLLDLLIRWVHHAPEERKKYFKELVDVVNFERICPEYITFMLNYFKNVVEVSDFENASGLNIVPPVEKSGSNFKLSDIEDSRNRLLLKEKCLKYFTINEGFANSDSEQVMTPPFQNPEFYKNELGLHVCLEYIAFSYGSRKENKEPWKKANVFSLTKYRPDWFLSCETDAWDRCSQRHTVSPQSTDTIYCLEMFYDRLDLENRRQSFCTYSSIDMSLPSNVLTPPPTDLISEYDHEFSTCATRNGIFLLDPKYIYWGEDDVTDIYSYNYEIDTWFPIQQTSYRRRGAYLTADDNLVYVIEYDGQARVLDYRASGKVQLPHSIHNHYPGEKWCTLNGIIYLAGRMGWETYDPKAGKWKKFKRPAFRNIYSDESYDNSFSLVKLLPYENMLWCIAQTSSILPKIYNVASYNPVSEEWYISNSINEILPNHVQMLQKKNTSYFFDHTIKDVIVFKTL